MITTAMVTPWREAHSNIMAYSHCTGTGPGQVQGTRPGPMGTNILSRNVPCLRQGKEPGSIVSIVLIQFPVPVPFPFTCCVNKPWERRTRERLSDIWIHAYIQMETVDFAPTLRSETWNHALIMFWSKAVRVDGSVPVVTGRFFLCDIGSEKNKNG